MINLKDQRILTWTEKEENLNNAQETLEKIRNVRYDFNLKEKEQSWLVLHFIMRFWKEAELESKLAKYWVNDMATHLSELLLKGDYARTSWDRELFSMEFDELLMLNEFQTALTVLIDDRKARRLKSFCHPELFTNRIALNLIDEIENNFQDFRQLEVPNRNRIVNNLEMDLKNSFQERFIAKFEYYTLTIYIILASEYFQRFGQSILRKLSHFMLFLSIPNLENLKKYSDLILDDEEFSSAKQFTSFVTRETAFKQCALINVSYNWIMARKRLTENEKNELIHPETRVFHDPAYVEMQGNLERLYESRIIDRRSEMQIFIRTIRQLFHSGELDEFQMNFLTLNMLVMNWKFQMENMSNPPHRKEWYTNIYTAFVSLIEERTKARFINLLKQRPTFYEEFYEDFQELLVYEFNRIFQLGQKESADSILERLSDHIQISENRLKQSIIPIIENHRDLQTSLEIYLSERSMKIYEDMNKLDEVRSFTNTEIFLTTLNEIRDSFLENMISGKEYHFLLADLAIIRGLSIESNTVDTSWWEKVNRIFQKFLKDGDIEVLEKVLNIEIVNEDNVKKLFVIPMKIEKACINFDMNLSYNERDIENVIKLLKKEVVNDSVFARMKDNFSTLINGNCCTKFQAHLI